MKTGAKIGLKVVVRGQIVSADGKRTLTFTGDDSLRSWWAIFRWNLHYGYWRAILRHNIPDLPKYLWRSAWRRMS